MASLASTGGAALVHSDGPAPPVVPGAGYRDMCAAVNDTHARYTRTSAPPTAGPLAHYAATQNPKPKPKPKPKPSAAAQESKPCAAAPEPKPRPTALSQNFGAAAPAKHAETHQHEQAQLRPAAHTVPLPSTGRSTYAQPGGVARNRRRATPLAATPTTRDEALRLVAQGGTATRGFPAAIATATPSTWTPPRGREWRPYGGDRATPVPSFERVNAQPGVVAASSAAAALHNTTESMGQSARDRAMGAISHSLALGSAPGGPTRVRDTQSMYPAPRGAYTQTTREATPPGNEPSWPTLCHCGSAIQWPKQEYFSTCSECHLSLFMTPRECPTPTIPPGIESTLRIRIARRDTEHEVPPISARGDDARWCTMRRHPDKPSLVVVLRFTTVVATLDVAHAAYLRMLILQQRARRAPGIAMSEYEVAAAVANWCEWVAASPTAALPFPATERFPDRFFTWMPWNAHVDNGIYHRARLSPLTGPTPRWHRDASSWCDITDLGSPLSYPVYNTILQGHPYRAWFLNGIRFGFSTLSDPPNSERPGEETFAGLDYIRLRLERKTAATALEPDAGAQTAGSAATNPLSDAQRKYFHDLMDAVDKELAMRAFVKWPIPGEPTDGVVLRFARFFGVPKDDGSLRAISDLSHGDDSVNDHTSRRNHWKARLAKVDRVGKYTNYARTAFPAERVFAVKFDAVKAFRQMPVPAREACLMAHRIAGDVFIQTRLAMGAKASGDSMAPAISAIRDYIAQRLGVFSESYSDDHLILLRESQLDLLPKIKSLWLSTGWRIQEAKEAEGGSPATAVEFLGIAVDLTARTFAMPSHRRTKLLALLDAWLEGSIDYTAHDFASLSGKLQFAAGVVPFGKAFISSLYRFTDWAAAPERVRAQHLPVDVRCDVAWWRNMIANPNHLPVMSFAPKPWDHAIEIWTDASRLGMGMVCHTTREYCAIDWTGDESEVAIAVLEGAAIVAAMYIWGTHAANRDILLYTDSESCQLAFSNSRCSDLRLRMILRILSLMQLRSATRLHLVHVSSEENAVADPLSRRKPIPPEYSDYTRVYLDSTTLSTLLDLLRTWLAGPNTGPSHLEQLYRRFAAIAQPRGTNPQTPMIPTVQWTL